jgi:fatty acid-binding protein DegV/DNA-binding NarL/FixJ family response regulator
MAIPHLLYVDNDFESKRKNTVLLFSNRFEVVPVSSLKEALHVMRGIRFELVIVDMHLPDGDADHLLQTMKSSPALAKIPVVVVSSMPNDRERQNVLDLGATACVLKDSDPEIFLSLVKDTLNQYRDPFKVRTAGISGQLAKTKIVDLIMDLASEHGSGVIHIDGKIPMEIHLRDGQIVHAKHGITVGKKALFRCVSIAEAAFHFNDSEAVADQSIAGDLDLLLEEARQSNEKLMANFHLLPSRSHRIRIVNPEPANSNLKTEARAALEIIRKYPRVSAYIDHLNLPDIACYEYLLTFHERGWVEWVTDHKPVRVITDMSCDLSTEDIKKYDIQVFPVQLKVDNQSYIPSKQEDQEALYRKKPKVLATAAELLPHEKALYDRYREWVDTHDCLSIFAAASQSKMFNHVQAVITKLQADGIEGKSLLANELVTLNSHSLSIGLGLAVARAGKMAAEGVYIEEIEEHIIEAIAKMHIVFAVWPDKSFLVKKGNTPTLMYWDRDAYEIGQRLGRGEDYVPALVKEIVRRMDRKARLYVQVGHVNAKSEAMRLAAEIHKDIGGEKPRIASIGALTGYQLGEKAISVAFYQD